MKKLTMKMIDTKAQIARHLENAEADVYAEVHVLNNLIEEHSARIEAAQGRLQEVVWEATAFIQEVQAEQEQYQGNRSDAWHDSENGSAYRTWADEWGSTLDEIDLCCPDPMEEPDLEAASLFRDLPDHP